MRGGFWRVAFLFDWFVGCCLGFSGVVFWGVLLGFCLFGGLLLGFFYLDDFFLRGGGLMTIYF